MRFHERPVVADLAATLAKITNQLFATFELRARRLVAIEIADQTNSERNVVEIIAVHVPTVDLPAPAIADFDLAVSSRRSVPDHEMISEPVLHSPEMAVIIIEGGCIALTSAAVVHNDILPAAARDGRAINLRFDRRG